MSFVAVQEMVMNQKESSSHIPEVSLHLQLNSVVSFFKIENPPRLADEEMSTLLLVWGLVIARGHAF
jgi:hypothetical protein